MDFQTKSINDYQENIMNNFLIIIDGVNFNNTDDEIRDEIKTLFEASYKTYNPKIYFYKKDIKNLLKNMTSADVKSNFIKMYQSGVQLSGDIETICKNFGCLCIVLQVKGIYSYYFWIPTNGNETSLKHVMLCVNDFKYNPYNKNHKEALIKFLNKILKGEKDNNAVTKTSADLGAQLLAPEILYKVDGYDRIEPIIKPTDQEVASATAGTPVVTAPPVPVVGTTPAAAETGTKAGGGKKVKYQKTDKKVLHNGKNKTLYVGKRGAQYVKTQGKYERVKV